MQTAIHAGVTRRVDQIACYALGMRGKWRRGFGTDVLAVCSAGYGDWHCRLIYRSGESRQRDVANDKVPPAVICLLMFASLSFSGRYGVACKSNLARFISEVFVLQQLKMPRWFINDD